MLSFRGGAQPAWGHVKNGDGTEVSAACIPGGKLGNGGAACESLPAPSSVSSGVRSCLAPSQPYNKGGS